MKLKLRYFKVAYLLVVGVASLVMPYLLISGANISLRKNIYWVMFFFSLVIFVIIRIWYSLLFEINEVEISETGVKIKNIITRQQREIKGSATRFKMSSISGKIILFDKEGNVIVKLVYDYYSKSLFKFYSTIIL